MRLIEVQGGVKGRDWYVECQNKDTWNTLVNNVHFFIVAGRNTVITRDMPTS